MMPKRSETCTTVSDMLLVQYGQYSTPQIQFRRFVDYMYRGLQKKHPPSKIMIFDFFIIIASSSRFKSVLNGFRGQFSIYLRQYHQSKDLNMVFFSIFVCFLTPPKPLKKRQN